MKVEIIHKNLTIDMYGFSGMAVNNDYAGTAFKLMGKTWQVVKTNNLKNKGMNIWVYERNEMVFAGVELHDPPHHTTGLEHKVVVLPRYAYYKHIGPYKLIQQAGQNMKVDLRERGYETKWPYVEIYGHWTNDETKLETDLLMSLT